MKLHPIFLILIAAALPSGLLLAQGHGPRGGPPPPMEGGGGGGGGGNGGGNPMGPPPPPQTPQLLTALDTDGDGIISGSEMATASASLAKLDTNGDGKLTPDEYGPLMSGTSGTKRTTQSSSHRFGGGPPPNGGVFDRAGIAYGLVRVLSGTDGVISAESIADAPALLKLLDKNGDGMLSPAEYGPEKSPLVWALDTDGDGIISADEITNADKTLKLLDKNGDGALTVDEYDPSPPGGSHGHGRHGKSSSSTSTAATSGTAPAPPESPLVSALDTDGDGVISAAEIKAAPTTLKTLDTNGDGQLGPGEYNPPPPAPKD